MASVKLHVYRGDNDGTESCDYRGALFIGEDDGDHHRTVLEIDPASDELIDTVLDVGLGLNDLLGYLTAEQPDALSGVASALGLGGNGPVGLRIGVWDN